MTIHYCSDLHLEFAENRKWLEAHLPVGVGDVLVLAGDIIPLGMLPQLKGLLQRMTEGFGHVYWLPGNHEFYREDIAQWATPLDREVLLNLRLVNNVAVTHGSVRLLLTTLWARIAQMNEWALKRNVSDFHLIRHGDGLLLPAQFTRLHEEALVWLQGQLAQPWAGQTVVATHHVPTLMHYPEEYRGSDLNDAFAVELHDLIADSGADAWIYGHHHRNVAEFTIGRTRMLTNQLGYVGHGEEKGFGGFAECKIDTIEEKK